MCNDELGCVRSTYTCDSDPDCLDGEDEGLWCQDKVCTESEYQLVMGCSYRGSGVVVRLSEWSSRAVVWIPISNEVMALLDAI